MTVQRFLIFGVTGSGKSTLAARISERTGIDWTEADYLTWEPGWVTVEPAEQRRRISEIVSRERWILDTAYAAWLDLVLPRTELIVLLDYPRWRSLGRLTRRTVGRVLDRREICNGNTESLRGMLSADSIIAWHFRSFADKRRRIRQLHASTDGPATVRFTSPRQTRRWLGTL